MTLTLGVLLGVAAGWNVERFPLIGLFCAIVATVLIQKGLG